MSIVYKYKVQHNQHCPQYIRGATPLSTVHTRCNTTKTVYMRCNTTNTVYSTYDGLTIKTFPQNMRYNTKHCPPYLWGATQPTMFSVYTKWNTTNTGHSLLSSVYIRCNTNNTVHRIYEMQHNQHCLRYEVQKQPKLSPVWGAIQLTCPHNEVPHSPHCPQWYLYSVHKNLTVQLVLKTLNCTVYG
jgi:hypothetical protein